MDFLIGGTAAMCAGLFSNPFDVIKTRQQLQGGMAGIAGSAIGCPFYMIKTQIQAQSNGQFAVGNQHQHSGTVSALITTYKTQGFKGLWRGFTGIVPRTAVGSAIQLTTFTKCKDFFLKYEKHSGLDMWITFNQNSARIEKTRDENMIARGVKRLKLLDESEFFIAYGQFEQIMNDFNERYAHKFDKVDEHMKTAAKVFFSNLFNTNPNCPNVTVDFEKKKVRGVQGGFICVVKITQTDTNVEIKKYHVKTHSRVSSHRSGDADVDLREMFDYKLLKMINIGPKVYFIPNTHKSRFGMYITTEDVYGFKMHSETRLNSEQVAKLDLLEFILILTDLKGNSNNFGCDDKGNLIIVDFQIDNESNSAARHFKNENYDKHLTSLGFPTVFDEINNAITSKLSKINVKKSQKIGNPRHDPVCCESTLQFHARPFKSTMISN